MDYVLEDVRLSTLQRKLIRETNTSVSHALALQISESIGYPDNRAYVKRATDILCDAIIDVFFSKHTEQVKRESAVSLGIVGYVLSDQQEFNKFYQLLWDGYDKCKKEVLQVYFVRSLAPFLRMRPAVTDQDLGKILKDLQDLLEQTENGPIMIAVAEAMQEMSKWRPKLFEPSFQDIVDILVGWHIDSSQTPSVRSRTSEILLSWHSFWIIDLEFSSSLLSHFMEDIETCSNDIGTSTSREEIRFCCEKLLSLVQVFNTVLSCLKSPHSTVSFLPPESSTWLKTILDCFLPTLKKSFNEDIMVAGQHALILLMERIDTLFTHHKDSIMVFTWLNIESYGRLSFGGMEAVIRFVTKMLQLVDEEEHNKIFRRMLNYDSFMVKAIFSLSDKVREAASHAFQLLLKSKSVLVLQEVYSHLLALIEEALFRLARVERSLKENKFRKSRFSQRQLRVAFTFVMGALSNTVATKGSVLSMWALDPSVFQWLNCHSGIHSREMVVSHPWIHYALVKALHTHCSIHGFFASNSSLVAQAASFSPTAAYFEQSLVTIRKLIEQEGLADATSGLVLRWLKDMLLAVSQSSQSHVLRDAAELNIIHKLVLKNSVKEEKKEKLLELLKVARAITNTTLDLHKNEDTALLLELHSIYSIHLRSVWPEVQEMSRVFLQRLPPLFLDQREERAPAEQFLRDGTRAILQMKLSCSPNDFKAFIETILKSPLTAHYHEDKAVQHLELNYPHDAPSKKRFVTMLVNEDLRCVWMSLSASQFCVNNKLKTPLGKAQETLTTIEKVIRNIVQNLMERNTKVNISECKKLLTFHRILEVTMSNAFDGSALSLPPPNKSIAMFFSANKKTCLEWLSRIRIAVIELAYSTDDFCYVVQNAQDILPRLAAAIKLPVEQKADQDRVDQLTLISAYLASALTRLGDSDALLGLYLWCRKKLNKKFRWIKCLADIVGGSAEKGLEYFQSVLKSELAQESRSLTGPAMSVVCNELFLGHLRLCQHKQFDEFMAEHREKFDLKGAPLKESYLKTLSQFENGTIQLAEWKEDGLDLDSAQKEGTMSTEELLLSSQMLLLNMAACFQRNQKRLPSWSESEKLPKALKAIRDRLEVLSRERANTLQTSLQIAIMSRINEELNVLIQNRPGETYHSLLSFRKGCHSSQVLMTIKKWGEFFNRYRKADPKSFFQVNAGFFYIRKLYLNITLQTFSSIGICFESGNCSSSEERGKLQSGKLPPAKIPFGRHSNKHGPDARLPEEDGCHLHATVCGASSLFETVRKTLLLVLGEGTGGGHRLRNRQQHRSQLVSPSAAGAQRFQPRHAVPVIENTSQRVQVAQGRRGAARLGLPRGHLSCHCVTRPPTGAESHRSVGLLALGGVCDGHRHGCGQDPAPGRRPVAGHGQVVALLCRVGTEVGRQSGRVVRTEGRHHAHARRGWTGGGRRRRPEPSGRSAATPT